ncbi:MAG: hypothetical protein NHB32_27045 [Fischerella sp. CENA71]|nr:hypothetical protein [Fischerella sp. CENA71]
MKPGATYAVLSKGLIAIALDYLTKIFFNCIEKVLVNHVEYERSHKFLTKDKLRNAIALLYQ